MPTSRSSKSLFHEDPPAGAVLDGQDTVERDHRPAHDRPAGLDHQPHEIGKREGKDELGNWRSSGVLATALPLACGGRSSESLVVDELPR